MAPHTEHEGVIAKEGAAAHRLLELCLKKKQDAEDFLEEEIYLPREKEHYLVSEEMVDHIQAGIDLIRAKVGKGQMWLENPTSSKTHGVVVGGTLDTGWYGKYPKVDDEGMPDKKAGLEFQLHILDLKYGRLLVEANDNKQLLIYGLNKYKELMKAKKPVDSIHLWIYQPRAEHYDTGPFQHIVISPFELFEFESELEEVVEQIQKPKPKFTAGSHCLYCRAHAVCAEAERATFQLMKRDYSAADTGRIGELLKAVPRVLAWAKAIKDLGNTMGQNGKPPLGFVMGLGRSSRRFPGNPHDKDFTKKTITKIRKVFPKLKEADLAPPKLLSVAKIEKMLPKGDARKKFSDLYITVRGKDRLVPIGSKGVVDAADYFDTEDEEG